MTVYIATWTHVVNSYLFYQMVGTFKASKYEVVSK